MSRAARWGALIVLGATLVALWLVLARVAAPPVSATRSVSGAEPSPIESPVDARDHAIFQEVVKARERAMLEAQTTAPLPDGTRLPFAPDSSRKGEVKRTSEADGRTVKSLYEIATAHGMAVEDLEELYRRGEAQGWPRR